MDYIKRFLLISLSSIILVCSVPQFSIRSKAIGTTTTSVYTAIYLLSTYFATRGYSIINNSDHTFTSLADWRNQSLEDASDFLYELSVRLNTFGASFDSPGLGDEVMQALSMAALTGSFILSQSTRSLLDLWIDSQTSSSGSLSVGSQKIDIQTYKHDAGFTYSNYDNYNVNFTLTFDVPTIAFVRKGYSASDTTASVFYLPADIEDYTYNALNNRYQLTYSTNRYYPTRSVTYNGATYIVPEKTVKIPSYSAFTVVAENDVPSVDTMVQLYLSGAYAYVYGGDLSVNRITDTTTSSVLTPGTSISSTGVPEGEFVYYLIDEASLVDIIDKYNSSSISYDELLKSLGLSSVANDASISDKETALASVVYPDSTYDWLTRTMWGADTVRIANDSISDSKSEEKTIVDSVSNTLKGGNDSQDDNDKSRGKGLLAALLLGLAWWNTPIIAGDPSDESDSGGTNDDSSGGGSNPGMLSETIAGMSIAGGLVNSFFNAAGGSDGYGFIYTVGASFVIFSVVIGAANYFGALFHGSDTNPSIKTSAKQNKPDSGKGNKSSKSK